MLRNHQRARRQQSHRPPPSNPSVAAYSSARHKADRETPHRMPAASRLLVRSSSPRDPRNQTPTPLVWTRNPSVNPSLARFFAQHRKRRRRPLHKYPRSPRPGSAPPCPPPPSRHTNPEKPPPRSRGASTLKSVSRSRSLVGRVASPAGASSVRDRNRPAMMRIAHQHTGRDSRYPLQSRYARLVNPAGPLDGRRDARPRLLPLAGSRLPGAQRCRRLAARPGPVPRARGRGRRARNRAPAGRRLARACACAPFSCFPSAGSLPTPIPKARKTPTRAAANLPWRSPGPWPTGATALVLAAAFLGASGNIHLLAQPFITLRLSAAQHGLDAGRPRPAAPAARLSAGFRPPASAAASPASTASRPPAAPPPASARCSPSPPWSAACCSTIPGSSSPASSS